MVKKKKKLKQKRVKNTPKFTDIIIQEIKNNNLRDSFSEELTKFAEIVAKKKISSHEDLTQIPFITIDGKNSQDHDDAVYVSINKTNVDIYIAVSDVSHYVKKNDLLDIEARKRANSFYFPDRVLPMLPHIISSNVCSIIPNKIRACLMVKTNIDLQGNINFYEIKRVKIRSVAKLTYDEVEDYIQKKNRISKKIEYLIDDLLEVYLILEKKSFKRSKLNFRTENFTIELQDSKFRINKKKQLISERIIEELMIHTNMSVARFLLEKKIKSNFRNHEEPTDKKLEKLCVFCNQNSISFLPKKKITQKDLIGLLDQSIIDTNIFTEFILKSQSKAFYDDKNKGHFGLALKEYTHFTSPIRRYSDLMVHRDIINYMQKEHEKVSGESQIFNHLINQEKKSEKLERNLLLKACCLVLKKQKKKKYSGFIDGFNEKGIYVKGHELPFYAFQKFNSLSDDFYIFDENEQCAVGKTNGEVLKLGQKVHFKIKLINSNNGKILLNSLKKVENDKL